MVGLGELCPPHLRKPRSHDGAGLFRYPKWGGEVRPAANPKAELTARQLAQALDVTPQLVNRWHTDGYLTRDGERVYLAAVGRNRRGHRLFRYLDGAIAEAATRQSPKSYRKPIRRPTSGAGSWAERDRKPATQLTRTG